MSFLLTRPRLFGTRRHEVVAGVDLGSNSFHLIVARAEADGRVHVLDRLRDPVRLASGLDENRELSPDALQRAVAALERMGERVRDMPDSAVRAVGTHTLRLARNGHELAERGSQALGQPIEIISGREEARLIHQGVAHLSPEQTGRQLVLDIGGGSTECIIGEGFEPLVLDSLRMGCVSYTERFFGNGRMTRDRFTKAEIAAELEFSSIETHYREVGWQLATGSSGTILAVRDVLRAGGWTDDLITLPALEKLRAALIDRKRIHGLELPGLERDRAPVFAGGVAILYAAFQRLGIEAMDTSGGALREGLVYELLEQPTEGDPRDRSIETIALRYKVDPDQSRRVQETALGLFEQANVAWKLPEDSSRHFLAWAARVHEIGLSISYSGYHKHGAYILRHTEMPGFSLDEQIVLAIIVGAHRRRLSREPFQEISGSRRKLALNLTLLLRLAVRLLHSRSGEPLPHIELEARKSRVSLSFPTGWLAERPLTQADLEEESDDWDKIDWTLSFQDSG